MDIFEMNYYPPDLKDWWMDDWISLVYGRRRTFKAKKAEVISMWWWMYQFDDKIFKHFLHIFCWHILWMQRVSQLPTYPIHPPYQQTLSTPSYPPPLNPPSPPPLCLPPSPSPFSSGHSSCQTPWSKIWSRSSQWKSCRFLGQGWSTKNPSMDDQTKSTTMGNQGE